LEDRLLSKHSVIQRIWNSSVISGWLQKQVRSDGGVASALRAAKHRFESYATPLGRMIRHIRSFLDVVEDVVRRRAGTTEGHDCNRWLQGLTTEKLILLSMVADLSDEILVLTRIMDDEGVDAAKIMEVTEDFLARIHGPFDHGQCLHVAGYTHHMLKELETCRVFLLSDGQVNSVGGKEQLEDAAVTQRCLNRMRRVVATAEAVLRAKFPDFELFMAFRVFNLSGAPATGSRQQHRRRRESVMADGDRSHDNDEATRNLTRIAKACGVRFGDLET
jgi:hypothetical protein